ncbi:MAG: phospholipase D-like domain-containing protein [Pseudomonadota bacterium]
MPPTPSASSDTPTFPWRDGNRFELLIDGGAFFPAMLDAVAAARSFVLLEMYLVESGQVADQFITAFCDAAARGVAVYLLLDDFGTRGLTRSDRERLSAGRVEVAYFNRLHYGRLRRNFFRDHRKLLVIDGGRAFVGGMGLTDEFAPVRPAQPPWRETVVAIAGPVVADWHHLFTHTWRRYARSAVNPPPTAPSAVAGARLGRVCYTRGIAYPEIQRSALNRIRRAVQRVWIATAYFVPSSKLRRALIRAARRGVEVRLLLPGPHSDHPAVRHAGRRFYYRLLHHGVRIFEYQPRFTHSKVLLCDDWVSIGSSNIDRWTMRWNLEANQEIADADFAADVHAMLNSDFAESKEYLLPHWKNRPWYRRLLERFWGGVDVWLERWFGGHDKTPR